LILKRSAVRDNAQRFARGIVKHLAGITVGEMSFKLLANLGREFVVEKVSQLGYEIMAANHAFTPAPAFAK
jgi:uncharacterized protein (DUF697 family)